ncbi:pyrimidine 5'-nucleotidase [Spirochaetia bacterium]|nr:pyrimidine 5'-nucleotidase [Spirochaetia bacterium]
MIQYLLFDLDNTLYSARFGLEEKVAQRMIRYAARYLHLSVEETAAQRKDGETRHGTTLEWLMYEKGFTDIEEYYQVIHPADEADTLPADPELRKFLEALPCPKAILTNSNREHVDLILSKLKLENIFTHIFDIRWNNFQGKPRPEVFLRALDALGTRPETTLFIDDYPRYVSGYIAIGGKGILLDEFDLHQDYPHPRIRKLEELVDFL